MTGLALNEATVSVIGSELSAQTDAASLFQFMRNQFIATWMSVHTMRVERVSNSADLVAWASNLTAQDWRWYARYAELRATAFAYVDSGSVAGVSGEAARHEALHETAAAQASANVYHWERVLR